MNKKGKKELYNRVDFLESNSMIFSAMALFETASNAASSIFLTLQYSESLRQCKMYDIAMKVLSKIDVSTMSSDLLFYYHSYYGSLYLDMNKLAEAKLHFYKCFSMEICDSTPYVLLAVGLIEAQHFNEAIELLKKALSKEGPLEEVFFNLAFCYSILGEVSKALDAIDESLKINPMYKESLTLKMDLEEYINIRRQKTSVIESNH